MTAPRTKLLEVCIDNLISAIEAEKGGAKRLELCSSLTEGGLTPSFGFLKVVKRTVRIPVFVMIRPRGGDFLYAADEVEIMKEDIRALKELGADGFVFGCLDEDGKIDRNTCAQLINVCGDKPITFHRAFDLTSEEPLNALEILIQLGFSRLLTSGRQSTAQLGMSLIRNLVNAAKSRLTIMPGSGITPGNVGEIMEFTGATEVHGSARKVIVSKMYKADSNVSMGNAGKDDTNTLNVADSQIVAAILRNCQSIQ